MDISAKKERRSHDRTIFRPKDDLIGVFSLLNQRDRRQSARILNISYDGIGFAIEREKKEGVEKDSVLVFHEMRAGENDSLDLSLTHIRVVWLVDHEFLDYVGFGCEYQEKDPLKHQAIFAFIHRVFPDRLP